jgi:hypothetical protein
MMRDAHSVTPAPQSSASASDRISHPFSHESGSMKAGEERGEEEVDEDQMAAPPLGDLDDRREDELDGRVEKGVEEERVCGEKGDKGDKGDKGEGERKEGRNEGRSLKSKVSRENMKFVNPNEELHKQVLSLPLSLSLSLSTFPYFHSPLIVFFSESCFVSF